ncbi:MAG TPA: hypothetical protein VKW70_08520 [Terriglobia bacterium]|nr:hypothetical protein [Terriglobia bacterium]
MMKRRAFLKRTVTVPALGVAARLGGAPAPEAPRKKSSASSEENAAKAGGRSPRRIPNEYTLFLPGEREALRNSPRVDFFQDDAVKARHRQETRLMKVGDTIAGWQLLAIVPWMNGIATAVFERHVTHRGAIAYVTTQGEIAHIPKLVGDLSKIRPRPIYAPPDLKFERPAQYIPGPDKLGDYILNSSEDPSYENVAALGEELIGWTLVANEQAGPLKSLWLEADGKSRQLPDNPQGLWAPDLTGRLFDPRRLLPSEYHYEYVHGYSKRTLLGGYLPVADIGVWNPNYNVGYEVMAVLPPGKDARPLGRVRAMRLPEATATVNMAGDPPAEPVFIDRYWNGSPEDFYSALAGIWNHWHDFFNQKMRVEIPDEWLLDAARAGIVLSRCSYRGLNPTYQIGEGAYTKIPERSHALFPVAHYEFVWAHQLWNLTEEVEPYFEHYLQNYILPDGNFLYNTQDQVEAPLNAGVFLENSARAYDYTRNFEALKRRLPVLRRMIDFVVKRYQYSKQTFPPDDPRHGLIWGSPEADNGDPQNDFPESHPYYYQNASWTWRGLREQARCLSRAGNDYHDDALRSESRQLETLAAQMRTDIERSLQKTLEARNPAMKEAGITPFTPFDTTRKPTELTSYENHRYMMDWWTSDWGDPALDEGHFKHRLIAGEQMMGMNTDGHYPRTSNFMSHGTLAGRIRQEDYRPFLLTLYGLCCYTMDCGNRYSPEDALLPGNYPGEGSPYGWSAVVNSELQPAMGLRWLLCYEEHDRDVVHLQKAAPQHWFKQGEKIRVWQCPTRFGLVSWTTESAAGGAGRPQWQVKIQFAAPFNADLVVHIHPPDRQPLRSASMGQLQKDRIILPASLLAGKTAVELTIA